MAERVRAAAHRGLAVLREPNQLQDKEMTILMKLSPIGQLGLWAPSSEYDDDDTKPAWPT